MRVEQQTARRMQSLKKQSDKFIKMEPNKLELSYSCKEKRIGKKRIIIQQLSEWCL